ncbi:MAG: SPOR domain-containing protein [Kofleriaceae bacterium]
MPTPELYKDKIEVSLDGRQIFYLFFGGAVIVGLVFVLGVMVGRRVEARGHVDRLDHARSQSDPLAALDNLEADAKPNLSFRGALTNPTAAQPSDVERTIDELEKSRAVEKKEPEKKKPEPEKKPEGKPVVKPDQADAKPAKKPDAHESANPDVITQNDKADKADKVDKDKSHARSSAEGDAKSIDKKPEAKGKFTLQLSSFQDKQEADAFLASVKSAGYQAYVTEASVNDKTFYRVRLGTYRSMEAANDAKADVEKSLKKSASVMRL